MLILQQQQQQLLFSCEQPGNSVMFYLYLFKPIQQSYGMQLRRWCSCSFASPFMKPFAWLNNMPYLDAVDFPSGSSCGRRGKHFKVEGCFTPVRMREFASLRSGDIVGMFGRDIGPGELVSAFSVMYPWAATRRMATETKDYLKLYYKFGPQLSKSPADQSPHWVSELATSQKFTKLFAYDFRVPGPWPYQLQ